MEWARRSLALAACVLALAACGGHSTNDAAAGDGAPDTTDGTTLSESGMDASTDVRPADATDAPGSDITQADAHTDSMAGDTVHTDANAQDRVVQDVADPCASATDCFSCAEQGSCGWCGATQSCSTGTASGSSSGTCSGTWTWLPSQCPGVADASADAMTNPCTAASDCASCTALDSCGWCADTNSCLIGTGQGPSESGVSCANWSWTASMCGGSGDAGGPPSCSSHTACGDCTQDVNCGFCNDDGSCHAGTSSGPNDGTSCASWTYLLSECGGTADAGTIGTSNIQHVVLIVEENHTFDAYFGRYCTAPTGSEPQCNTGPSCCEAAPDTDPSGSPPIVLDDDGNTSRDPDHSRDCETAEMDNGAMDQYVTGASCSNAGNFGIAPDSLVQAYHDYASNGALADRYFQPLIGSTSANDMYFAIAAWQFFDNDDKPATDGAGCTLPATRVQFQGRRTIADLILGAGHTFGVYAVGYQAMIDALLCPLPPSDCSLHVPFAPCTYDPSDIPFEYYAQFADNREYMHDYDALATDIANNAMPDFVYVKAATYMNEHPRWSTISSGVTFVQDTIQLVQTSAYASNTLILLTWDEGGGFFDHVTPPPSIESLTDGTVINYGTRVPLIAIGPFARQGYVSHVVMEHSSIIKFLEYNFVGPEAVGALGYRDGVVNNIGSLLDPTTTGIVIPEN